MARHTCGAHLARGRIGSARLNSLWRDFTLPRRVKSRLQFERIKASPQGRCVSEVDAQCRIGVLSKRICLRKLTVNLSDMNAAFDPSAPDDEIEDLRPLINKTTRS